MIHRSLVTAIILNTVLYVPAFAETVPVVETPVNAVVSDVVASAKVGTNIGDIAPAFSYVDTNGKTVDSAELKGKIVVLEWKNHQCPFVRKHYSTGNMQALQHYAAEQDIVWISVISSAEGKQGYVSADEANTIAVGEKSHPAHIILDAEGTFGNSYGAKVTPHLFIINKDGRLAYKGAVDNTPTADPEDIETADNYVKSALTALLAGGDVDPAESKPYGCAVKYDY
jgi:Redoxin